MTTTKTPLLVAAFADRMEAEKAVDDLEQLGFKESEVGFAIRGRDAVSGGMITDAIGTKDGKGALAGIVTGGVVGGILGAAAALVVPGVGPALAAGILWTALGGMGAGAAVGGIFGAMAGLGISEEEALFYEREFNSGRAIVTVKCGPRTAEAARVLRAHGGYDMHSQSSLQTPNSSADTSASDTSGRMV
ncbi:MAG TPA: hypothetical protein VIL86_06850 [Tepidisphaeraceae bacterium]